MSFQEFFLKWPSKLFQNLEFLIEYLVFKKVGQQNNAIKLFQCGVSENIEKRLNPCFE